MISALITIEQNETTLGNKTASIQSSSQWTPDAQDNDSKQTTIQWKPNKSWQRWPMTVIRMCRFETTTNTGTAKHATTNLHNIWHMNKNVTYQCASMLLLTNKTRVNTDLTAYGAEKTQHRTTNKNDKKHEHCCSIKVLENNAKHNNAQHNQAAHHFKKW